MRKRKKNETALRVHSWFEGETYHFLSKRGYLSTVECAPTCLLTLIAGEAEPVPVETAGETPSFTFMGHRALGPETSLKLLIYAHRARSPCVPTAYRTGARLPYNSRT